MTVGAQSRRIGDFAAVESGSTPLRDDPGNFGGEIPWVTTAEVADGEITSTAECLSKVGRKASRCKLFPPKSILVAMYGQGATRGRTALLGIHATTNQACAVILPSAQHEPRYLWHFLRGQYDALRALGRGGDQPNLNLGMVRGVSVPLPGLPDQRRIAAILDKADAIRRKRKEVLALADEFLRSAFLEMFGDPVTNPKGWPVVDMAEVVEETQYGTADPANELHDGLPVLRMNNVTYDGAIDTTDLKWCPIAEHDLDKYTLRRGDLLFNRTNIPELVGKTAVWDRDDAYAFAGYLIRVRFKLDSMLPEFVSAYLNSKHGKAYLREKAKPSNNMSNFSAGLFRTIPMPCPPVAQQERYRDLVVAVDRVRGKAKLAAAEADQLFNSLVQEAFSGNL